MKTDPKVVTSLFHQLRDIIGKMAEEHGSEHAMFAFEALVVSYCAEADNKFLEKLPEAVHAWSTDYSKEH